MGTPMAILFDIDGTLISTGGAGAKSWLFAFDKLHGVPADIGEFSEAGMTDPEVGRGTFTSVMGRDPSDREMARLLTTYLERLPHEVESSEGYRVLAGVPELLPRLCEKGVLLGLITGGLEAAAHIKLSRGGLNSYFCFGAYGSDSTDRSEVAALAIKRAGTIHGHPLDPGGIMIVGDTPRDIEAALANRAVAVGVASGKFSQEDLRGAGADHVLDSLTDPFPGL